MYEMSSLHMFVGIAVDILEVCSFEADVKTYTVPPLSICSVDRRYLIITAKRFDKLDKRQRPSFSALECGVLCTNSN
jgi:hypothetical protein